MKTIKKLNQELNLNIKSKLKGILTVLLIVVGVNNSNAQIDKLSGPRIGMTLVTTGSSADYINEDLFYTQHNKFGSTGAAFTTQFGWQWESRFGDGEGGIVGLVEWIALVGGLEKGKFLPSFSAIIGARTSKGLEFGIGPNVSLSGVGIVLGFGKNFKFGNLNVPLNLAFIPGVRKEGTDLYVDSNNETVVETYKYNTGSRISLIVGFNMIKNKRQSRIK